MNKKIPYYIRVCIEKETKNKKKNWSTEPVIRNLRYSVLNYK